jgi:hypothetical protein
MLKFHKLLVYGFPVAIIIIVAIIFFEDNSIRIVPNAINTGPVLLISRAQRLSSPGAIIYKDGNAFIITEIRLTDLKKQIEDRRQFFHTTLIQQTDKNTIFIELPPMEPPQFDIYGVPIQ